MSRAPRPAAPRRNVAPHAVPALHGAAGEVHRQRPPRQRARLQLGHGARGGQLQVHEHAPQHLGVHVEHLVARVERLGVALRGRRHGAVHVDGRLGGNFEDFSTLGARAVHQRLQLLVGGPLLHLWRVGADDLAGAVRRHDMHRPPARPRPHHAQHRAGGVARACGQVGDRGGRADALLQQRVRAREGGHQLLVLLPVPGHQTKL
mmetsp:Transcript_1455/g.3927  ORF Transcript_1455/g.3927 Transcript_1455/m.3927 type:complete len:205 (+) Transcript_1455:298-912(+)